MKTQSAYLAPEGFEHELRQELRDLRATHGRLMVCDGDPQDVAWVDNTWHDVREVPITSIGHAASLLKGVQRNWAHYPHEFHRRSALVVEKLPHVSAKPLLFGDPLPSAPLGSWTLTAKDRLLYAADCSSPFANGRALFVEDKQSPPNRAYLKLWEALTLLPTRPRPDDFCLDLGSSPGGWTWVLQSLGARVLSVDKAPLENGIDRLPGVEYRSQSAFALEPKELGPVDWLFCDIACYPQRLKSMLERWLDSKLCRNFVCTIKLQGDSNSAVLDEFRELGGGRVRHLWHNKHELTWIRLQNS